MTLIGRGVGDSNYSARMRLEPGGIMRLFLLRDEVGLGTYVLPGTYTAGEQLNVVVSVAGVSPTTIRAKAWRAGSPEPSGWNATASDATPALQVPGYVGIKGSISGSSTNSTTVLRFADFTAVTP